MALLIAATLAGCTSVKVESRVEQPQTQAYRRVYLRDIDGNDPVHVMPLIAEHLKRAGLELTVVKPGESTKERQGSGFVITTNGDILTCAHVVEGQKDVTAWIKAKRYTGKVIAADTNLDVAVVQLNGARDNFRPLPLARDPKYHAGANVSTIGFPLADVLGSSPRVSKGLLSADVGLKDDPQHVQISAEVQPGNSGGPLFDERGEVVGMVNATLNPINILFRTGGTLPQNVNFAIKTEAIEGFLRSANVELPSVAEPVSNDDLSSAGESIVLVRNGVVTENDLKAPALFCVCSYAYVRDPASPRLRALSLVFYDMQTERPVLRVSSAKTDYATKDYLLDSMFEKICNQLFPDRPNPFKKK